MTETPRDTNLGEEKRDIPFGERIKATRLSQHRSLTEVARSADISKAYLSQLENGGSTNPSFAIATSLAEALGLPVEEIESTQLLPNTTKPALSVDTEVGHSSGTTIEFKQVRDGQVVTRSTFRLNPGDRITIDLKMPKK